MNVDRPIITVIGTGYVGLTTATLFANAGFTVYALEINEVRLATVKDGKSYFYEEGLDALVKIAVEKELLLPTSSYADSIPRSDFVFSCVGTPDNPDGSPNLSYLFQAAETAAKLLKNKAVFVQKSTVPVGTGRKVETLLLNSNPTISYISNPEFLREGSALNDSLSGDRIVIGGDNLESINKLKNIYSIVLEKRTRIAKMAKLSLAETRTAFIATSLESAELIKVTANAFLAMKISFANSIAKLADHTDADIVEVMDAVGADKRIGSAFLNAGRGYGGGCFPKDVSGLISSAAEHGVDLPIMTAVSDINESMPGYIANKLLHALGTFEDRTIAVLGLAFKAGTSDARQSPGVKLANILSHSGASVKVFDPKANQEASMDLREQIKITKNAEEAFEGCDAVCVTTDWPEFIQYDLATIAEKLRTKILVDCMNSFDISQARNAGLYYIGVGRGSSGHSETTNFLSTKLQ